MKKLISVLCVCLAVMVITAGGAAEVFAQPAVDTQRASSIKLQYQYEETCFENVEVHLYHAASVTSAGAYILDETFDGYGINVNGIDQQSEWDTLASTMESYIAADQILSDAAEVTDGDGRVCFSNLKPGLYLIYGTRVPYKGGEAIFDTFFLAVPSKDVQGHLVYDVEAYPKCQVFVPDDEPITYRLVKYWIDDGYRDQRPVEIKVDLVKNFQVVEQILLSAENNWTYTWEAENDGSVWHAVERIEDGAYMVYIEKNQQTIVMTNTYVEEPEEDPEEDPKDPGKDPEKPKKPEKDKDRAPETGDTTTLWPYALGLCGAGGLLLILAIWRKRNNQ